MRELTVRMMDEETQKALHQRLDAISTGLLQRMTPEDMAARQLRACAMHLAEAADRVAVGDIAYGFIVAEMMSHELAYKAQDLGTDVMSLPLEGDSLADVLSDIRDAASHRLVDLLEKAYTASDDK